jgi:glycosyltransferase involved in cell wall biosynthesis
LENEGTQMFLQNLYDIDVVLAANTIWDELTNGFMLYVDILQQAGSVNPAVILDLCNLPDFDEPSLALWKKVIRGFIAPSVFVGMHPLTLESRKPVRIVYPSVSTLMASEEYHNSACKSKLQQWPRRLNGKFRVGCIGRLTFERSPGICILLIAEIVSARGRGFVEGNIEFVVTGSGVLLKNLYDLAMKLNIHELITFTGFVSDITEVLTTLDVAVNAIARGENFGILNTECVISCTPVIAFNRSATQESLSFGVSFSLLVQDVSLSSLVARLLAVLDGRIDIATDMLR